MNVSRAPIHRRWWWRFDLRKRWEIIAPVDDDFTCRAVVPRRDLVAHDPFDEDCVCGPHVRTEGLSNPVASILMHQALDGRR